LTPLLELREVTKVYAGSLRALDAVDLAVARGECLAVVGESGSGKTTLARCAMRLVEPSAGEVRFAGEDLLRLPAAPLRRLRRRFQMVFQDALGSLDPRQRVGAALGEPLALGSHTLSRAARARQVEELLATVGLPRALAERFPHELSGGQRQRVGIARALAPGPELVIADEPVSALDMSVRGQILNLLAEIQAQRGLTLVLIAHDLAMVEQMADRVAVLYLGRVVELGGRGDVFARPLHPYTVSLLSAVPGAVGWAGGRGGGSGEGGGGAGRRGDRWEGRAGRRDRIVLAGEPPNPAAPPPGCAFHTRCPIARQRCAIEAPPLADQGGGHLAACFFAGELAGPRRLGAPPAA
jgi:ABC-type oligopeptide transport system ATPase subunit